MSGADVAYRLRPNKTVDRELFMELLAYIDRFTPIRNHLYIGFGGPSLEDFRLIHSRLGILGLISLESDETVYNRQQFNKPFSCVKLRHLDSGSFVTNYESEMLALEFDPNANIIVWLDYAIPGELRQQFEEVTQLLGKLKTGDVVRITLNANPLTLHDVILREPEATRLARLAELKKRIGEFLPNDIDANPMTNKSYASVLARAMHVAIFEVMRSNPENSLQLLSAFRYSDSSHQMITLTSIMLPDSDIHGFFQTTRLSDWPHLVTE
jgi:hypothetical protein